MWGFFRDWFLHGEASDMRGEFLRSEGDWCLLKFEESYKGVVGASNFYCELKFYYSRH